MKSVIKRVITCVLIVCLLVVPFSINAQAKTNSDPFGLGDLTGLLERAEAAISKLETIANSLESSADTISKAETSKETKLDNQLSSAVIDYDKMVTLVEAPKNFYLKPYAVDNECYGIHYGLTYDDDICQIMMAKDNYSYLYQVVVEVEYSLNGKQPKTAYGVDTDLTLYLIPAVSFNGELFYLYYSIDEQEPELYDYLSEAIYETDGDWPSFCLDLSKNSFEGRARYMITNQKTGEISYSDWSNKASLSIKDKDPVVPKSLPDPIVSGDISYRYASFGNYADAITYITTVRNPELDKIAARPFSNIYVRCDAVYADGEETILYMPYNFMRYDGLLEIYMGEFEDIPNINSMTYKLRYEWYSDINDAGIEDPDVVSNWVTVSDL